MIIVGAKCDKCGRIETMNYMSEAALTVLLGQKGWNFEEGKTVCRICGIEEHKAKQDK